MANTLIPIEERSLSPEQVEHLDRRRRRGQLFLTICGQLTLMSLLLLLWSGQDATYSPGWHKPMVIWNSITATLALFFFLAGISLRRGSTEFISY